jgi:hypothetical protein
MAPRQPSIRRIPRGEGEYGGGRSGRVAKVAEGPEAVKEEIGGGGRINPTSSEAISGNIPT